MTFKTNMLVYIDVHLLVHYIQWIKLHGETVEYWYIEDCYMLFCVSHRVLFWEIWWKCVRGLGKLIFVAGFGVASYARFCNRQCLKFCDVANLCSQSLLVVVDHKSIMSGKNNELVRKTLNLKWSRLVNNCFSNISIYHAYKLPSILKKIWWLETRDDHIPP
jgi:hypothetical protein